MIARAYLMSDETRREALDRFAAQRLRDAIREDRISLAISVACFVAVCLILAWAL